MSFPVVTSPETIDYNCFAWAAEENTRRWEPDPMNIYFWPPNIPREFTLESFITAYATLGYRHCHNADLENGYQKIAIYVGKDGKPEHVARQLPNGNWTSKLGDSYDVEHEFITNWISKNKYWVNVKCLNLSGYGKLGCILKKQFSSVSPTPPANP
ncbi:MAG TPA: hypothetical protein VJC37_08780 [Planctomycetota bacterium]|nr:hypothetical protein [Planctomycetota bacterium]